MTVKSTAGAGLQPGPDIYGKALSARYKFESRQTVNIKNFAKNKWFNLQD
jgi:hypothetical protein